MRWFFVEKAGEKEVKQNKKHWEFKFLRERKEKNEKNIWKTICTWDANWLITHESWQNVRKKNTLFAKPTFDKYKGNGVDNQSQELQLIQHKIYCIYIEESEKWEGG